MKNLDPYKADFNEEDILLAELAESAYKGYDSCKPTWASVIHSDGYEIQVDFRNNMHKEINWKKEFRKKGLTRK